MGLAIPTMHYVGMAAVSFHAMPLTAADLVHTISMSDLGIAGYGSHLQYEFGQQVDSWGMMADWRIPLMRNLEWSGEAYRGRALGGLGGGIWQSVVYNGDPTLPTSALRPLNSPFFWRSPPCSPQPGTSSSGTGR